MRAGPRWRTWPPTRALEIERGEQLIEEPLSNEPRAFTSEIDPQYPVFGNPLTSTVRRNFAAARDEIEDLYRRIAELEASGGGPPGSGTVTSISAGTGLTGGTITGAGTIALATPVSLANGGTGVSAANGAVALTALGGAPLTSPNFNGVPTAPTAAAGTATMQVATTAFVENAVGSAGGGTVMSITAGAGLTGGTITTTGTIALDAPVSLAEGGTGIAAANAAAALAALGGAGLSSPALTGTPTAPTPAAADNSMALATTAFVKSQNYLTGNEAITLSGDVTGSGTTAVTATLATVNSNVGTFQGITVNAKGLVTAAIDEGYAPLASPPLTGTPTAPTATAGTDTTQVATTAFVKAAVDAIDALPTGGAIYDVLTKASATDGDVEWQRMVRLGGDTMTGPLVLANTTAAVNGANGGYLFEDQATAGQQWRLRATGGRSNIVDPAGVSRLVIGQGVGAAFPAATVYHSAFGSFCVSRNTVAEKMYATPANLHIVGGDTVNTSLVLDTFSAQGAIVLRAAGGTNAAMTPLGVDAFLGKLVFQGVHTAGSFSTAESAMIQAYTTEPWNSVACGTRLAFWTTLIGQTNSIMGLSLSSGLSMHAGTGAPNNVLPDMGLGTINAAGYYQDGEKIGGFAPSVGWAADTDPDNVSLFTNNTGRPLTIAAISGSVEAVNGSAATVTVVKAASGTALSAGTPVHGAPFDADLNAGSTQDITPFLGMTLGIGERLGLQATASAPGWVGSVASITVYLEP